MNTLKQDMVKYLHTAGVTAGPFWTGWIHTHTLRTGVCFILLRNSSAELESPHRSYHCDTSPTITLQWCDSGSGSADVRRSAATLVSSQWGPTGGAAARFIPNSPAALARNTGPFHVSFQFQVITRSSRCSGRTECRFLSMNSAFLTDHTIIPAHHREKGSAQTMWQVVRATPACRVRIGL